MTQRFVPYKIKSAGMGAQIPQIRGDEDGSKFRTGKPRTATPLETADSLLKHHTAEPPAKKSRKLGNILANSQQ